MEGAGEEVGEGRGKGGGEKGKRQRKVILLSSESL